jgi:hypothetical protein
VGSSWNKRPDPLRSPSWSRRRLGLGGQNADAWDGVDEVHDGHDTGDSTDEWAQDFHDPDPWGDSEPAAPVPSRSAPPVRRSAPGSAGGRVPGRKSRLPKMAEWRNGTTPRT